MLISLGSNYWEHWNSPLGNLLRALNLFLVLYKCTHSLASSADAPNGSKSWDLVVVCKKDLCLCTLYMHKRFLTFFVVDILITPKSWLHSADIWQFATLTSVDNWTTTDIDNSDQNRFFFSISQLIWKHLGVLSSKL